MSVCARALARTFSVFMLSLSSPDDPSGCRFARAWPPSAPPEALERRSTDYRKARHFFPQRILNRRINSRSRLWSVTAAWWSVMNIRKPWTRWSSREVSKERSWSEAARALLSCASEKNKHHHNNNINKIFSTCAKKKKKKCVKAKS